MTASELTAKILDLEIQAEIAEPVAKAGGKPVAVQLREIQDKRRRLLRSAAKQGLIRRPQAARLPQ